MTTDDIRRKLLQRLAEARGLQNSPENNAGGKGAEPARTIPPVSRDSVLPLSNAQERMWFLHRLDPSASAYNVCVLWHLRGNLDREALRKSAERITQRHSIFRTIYVTDESGSARQHILAQLPPEWSTADLRNLSGDKRATQLTALAQAASTAPFDLGSKSPLRLLLVALTDEHHVLVMVGQHIVWDGPSFGVFSGELADGYNLFCNPGSDKDADRFPSPPAQYVDFAHWHRLQWQTASAKRLSELAFWESQLLPLPEPLDFPADFDRNQGNDEAGDWCTESLDAAATKALLQLAGQEHLTPFEILVAAIALLMTRLVRSPEVTIGTIASHRNLPELHGVIGNFGNVVPLRLAVNNSWSFRKLLRQCAARCRAAFAHADLPFEYLLDHFNIPRGESRSPLLDTMVTFLSHGMAAPAMQGLDVQWQKHFNGTSQIDLSFDALLQDGCLHLQATWRRARYRPDTVPRHLRRLARLLSECVAAPDAPLAGHSLLLPEEYSLLRESWGRRPVQPAAADTLVGWFENTVRRHPQALALCGIDANNGLSFTALNARANRLARWLVARGIGPEDRVAIALPRQPEWFVAMLATLKAGAAFVPIDPAYPADYIKRVISLAQPGLGFIDSSVELDAPGLSVTLTAAEQAAAGLADDDLRDSERREPLQPAHPVCVIFTSGSSGKPKGVVVAHSALVNLLASHREDLYQQAARHTGRELFRVGHAWSFAFDASWQPALWMFDGHELHVFDVTVMQDPIALAREIIRRRLDFIELTPGMLDEVLPWLQSGLTDAGGKHLPGHVPAILGFGGESVKQALWERILTLETSSGFNLYGPTEACVDTMIAKAAANEPPNIGKPVGGAQVYVLDACLQLAPPGVAGELAIAGEGLARGYITRGDLTASQFIANPHGAPGARLYRTGDRVRWLPGGVMEYIGRIDEQVKIRGFRVEPLEVEATVEKLLQRPCAVVARPSASGTLQLLCFIETAGAGAAASADTDAMLQLCAASLPAHLVPKYIIPVQRLPRLPNGKINRRALVMPAGLETAQGRRPRTPLEHQLCRLMAEVLGRAQISIDDGFFELGGDSISVIKLVSLARRDGLTLTARQVFDARCAARLAPLLEAGGASPNHKAPVHDTEDTGPATPTPLMARYLSLGRPLRRFAQVVSLALPATIREAEIQALLDALLQRHAMLRARLVNPADTQGSYLELPAIEDAAQVQLADLSHLGDNASIARAVCERLEPSAGRMLAAALVRDQQRNTLWLAISHLVMDASSWHIVAGDLALGHLAQERGQPVALPPVPTAWRTWSAALAPEPASPAVAHGTLADAQRKSWVLPLEQGHCPATAAARRLGVPVAGFLPALTLLAAVRAGLVPGRDRTLALVMERQGREPSAPGQDLSRTVGWFARESRLELQVSAIDSDEALARLLQQWCGAIARLDDTEPLAEGPLSAAASGPESWQLGFNFLGDFAAGGQDEPWAPQPRMELLAEACGEDWPLLHNLDVSVRYIQLDSARRLCFDALTGSTHLDSAALDRLFAQLQAVLTRLNRPTRLVPDESDLKEVTPLQYEMLRHCGGDTDPWTTQMEIALETPPAQPLSAEALQQSAARLLSRHQALRAGFLRDGAATFIPEALEPDWQSLDWRGETAEAQQHRLDSIREQWHRYRFNLAQPPLVRFMALRLGEHQWRLLVNCHHLLLDGWSAPRILQEWLDGACGRLPQDEPQLPWGNYLDWLHSQDRTLAWRYWNRALHGLETPSLLCPGRAVRTPSTDLRIALSASHSKTLVERVRKAGVSSAALYQLAWALTLAGELGQDDVVFGLFDSGRTAPVEGLTTLVGLVTQLIPLRINTDSTASVATQLRELQARQFEWQAQVPVRMDNLEPAHRFGEFLDTLLVVENALDGDARMESRTAPSTPASLALIREQRWRDSIGQVAGLFVYPQHPIELRLCYDPLALGQARAQQLLARFQHHLEQLILGLDAEPTAPASTGSHQNPPLIPAETDHE